MMRLTSFLLLAPAAAHAQEPGVDEEGCKSKDFALLSRMPGCGLYECVKR